MKARYWDTNMFLGWLSQESDKYPSCAALIREAEAGNLYIVTSALTIAEVVWLRGKPRLPADQRGDIRGFFAHKYVQIRQLDRTTAELAQTVVWDHAVNPKDAIHVATALDALRLIGKDFDQFDTFDDDLIKKSGQIGDPPLRIAKPSVQERLIE